MSGDYYLDLVEVIQRVNLSKATIYRKVRSKTFPEQVTLSENRVAWLASEIDAWMEERKQLARPEGSQRWRPAVIDSAV